MLQFAAKYYFGDSLVQRDRDYAFYSGGKKYMFRPDVVKMYLSDIQLIQTGGKAVSIQEVSLFQLQEGNVLSILAEVPVGAYQDCKFTLGLSADKNNSNPNDFTSDHPLSTAKGMYWGMLKYRFMVIEGKLLDSTGTILNGVSFHTGIDLSKSIALSKSFELSSDKSLVITCIIDLKPMFDGLDPTLQTSTHSNPGADYDVAALVTNNISSHITWDVKL